jgi:sugar lactone lactonase YvrE
VLAVFNFIIFDTSSLLFSKFKASSSYSMKKVIILILVISSNFLSSQNINLFAGGGFSYTGDGGPALQAGFPGANSVKYHSNNVYISQGIFGDYAIRKIDPNGIITTIAGTGQIGFSGDGGAATLAQLNRPLEMAFDKNGNLYFTDQLNHRIRKINTSGIITTIAGIGTIGYSGDNNPAINAELNYPTGLVIDSHGNLYVSDTENSVIRKIDTLGIITTIAGTVGIYGYAGDGGLATNATLNRPGRMGIDKNDGIYISDNDHRIRKITSSGVITTIAGTGVNAHSGDGGLAIAADIYNPAGMDIDTLGNVFIAEYGANRVRKINQAGIITTIAGTGATTSSGDGGPAINSGIYGPTAVSLDKNGSLYVLEYSMNKVRVIYNIYVNTTNGVDDLKVKKSIISLFPNPNDGYFSVSFKRHPQNADLLIIDLLGQPIYNKKMLDMENKIILPELCSGIYTYIIRENNKQIDSGKISIQPN